MADAPVEVAVLEAVPEEAAMLVLEEDADEEEDVVLAIASDGSLSPQSMARQAR